jgi:hypothetical protein
MNESFAETAAAYNLVRMRNPLALQLVQQVREKLCPHTGKAAERAAVRKLPSYVQQFSAFLRQN